MATIDDEPDELSPDRQERRAKPSSWRKPLQLAGLGLALMLGGYAAMNYVPAATRTPRQIAQERDLAELREWAAKDRTNGTADARLSDRLERITPSWRTPPYQVPGRLALYGGLFLFVAAGVLMYRHAPSKDDDDSERGASAP